jgi:Leucine-rich repeat (LRR) protein
LQEAYENKKFDPIFKNVKKLQASYYSENINKDFFEKFTNLKTLTLIVNPNLKDSASHITLKNGIFKNLLHLETLKLLFSSIKIIEENCFPKSIKFIDLKGNKIEKISENTFQNLPNLERLNLANNPINSGDVNKNFFKGSFENYKNPQINFISI